MSTSNITCQNVVDYIKKSFIVHTIQSTNFQTYQSALSDWQNRRGEWARYQNHGISQDFTIEWGGSGQLGSADDDCRKCAGNYSGDWWEFKNYKGEDRLAKKITFWGDFQYCMLPKGTILQGADGYEEPDIGPNPGDTFRRTIQCKKTQNQKDRENIEYAQSQPRPEDYYKLPISNPENITLQDLREYPFTEQGLTPRPLNINLVCCGYEIKNITSDTGNVAISGLNQACSQQINTTQSSTSPTSPTPSPKTSPTTTSTSTFILPSTSTLILPSTSTLILPSPSPSPSPSPPTDNTLATIVLVAGVSSVFLVAIIAFIVIVIYNSK